ncbi:MAG: hypothetical protein IPK32_15010 [Verrucomicrobiaceae bacterium]|nr:hypothetical protein [Verrucomicrobiaceae bacterium]
MASYCENTAPFFSRRSAAPLSTDRRLAREGLLAGDAGLTRFLFSLQEPKAAPKDASFPADDPDHPLNQIPVPNLLREMVLFPFTRGFEFAQALHSAGSFGQLNAAYSKPPISCSELTDPEAYLAFTEVAPTIPKLGGQNVQLDGRDPFWDDQLGKFICLTVLRTHNTDENAALAATGLVTDRVLAWEAGPSAKRHHAAWQTLFKDADHAMAFHKAMSAVLVGRHGLPASSSGEPTDMQFEAAGRFIQLTRNLDGAGVLLLDTADAATREKLRQKFLSPTPATR